MRLALQLLTYNSGEYLRNLFLSLSIQSDKDWVLFVLDNASVDRDKVLEIIAEFGGRMDIRYFESDVNLGFSGGHQKLFEEHDAEFVMLVNHDAFFDKDYVELVMRAFDDENVAGASGLIYGWNWLDVNKMIAVRTRILDSAGLFISPSFAVGDRGSGRTLALLNRRSPVFGVSGCAAVYRRSAVLESSYDGRLFDPEYGSYKEDVDLAFRFEKCGFDVAIVERAEAFHKRGFGRLRGWVGVLGKVKKHLGVSDYLLFHSYRNHLYNLLTYLEWRDIVTFGVYIAGYELSKVVFYLIFRPKLLFRSFRDLVAYWPVIKKKRAFYGSRCDK